VCFLLLTNVSPRCLCDRRHVASGCAICSKTLAKSRLMTQLGHADSRRNMLTSRRVLQVVDNTRRGSRRDRRTLQSDWVRALRCSCVLACTSCAKRQLTRTSAGTHCIRQCICASKISLLSFTSNSYPDPCAQQRWCAEHHRHRLAQTAAARRLKSGLAFVAMAEIVPSGEALAVVCSHQDLPRRLYQSFERHCPAH
jgi:hypothetical protein